MPTHIKFPCKEKKRKVYYKKRHVPALSKLLAVCGLDAGENTSDARALVMVCEMRRRDAGRREVGQRKMGQAS